MSDLFHLNVFVDAKSVDAMMHQLETVLTAPQFMGFLTQAQEYFSARVDARFAGSGDDVVGRWAPLASYTQAERKALGYPEAGPINVRTGELKAFAKSAAIKAEQGGASLTMPWDTGSGELEAKFEHAQQGLDPNPNEGWRPVPARPVVGMDQMDMAEILSRFETWLLDHIGAGGAAGAVAA